MCSAQRTSFRRLGLALFFSLRTPAPHRGPQAGTRRAARCWQEFIPRRRWSPNSVRPRFAAPFFVVLLSWRSHGKNYKTEQTPIAATSHINSKVRNKAAPILGAWSAEPPRGVPARRVRRTSRASHGTRARGAPSVWSNADRAAHRSPIEAATPWQWTTYETTAPFEDHIDR